MNELHPVHYLPILTTIVSAAFCTILFIRWNTRGRGRHLLWWGMGVFFYGLGTLIESCVTLFGNTVFLNKSWYIAGALLGGYPLAQGTVYLLLTRKTADILTAITLPVIAITSIFVIVSPVVYDALEPHRPSGAILGWQWVRLLTPFINLYAAAFLIGGAFLSAWRYWRKTTYGSRVLGNVLIAIGAILPGIGGGMAKAGVVEALYIGEFVGILFIWAGYTACVKQPVAAAAHTSRQATA